MSTAIVRQFLCVVAMDSLPISEKEVTMGRMLVSVCGVRWDNRLLRLWVKAFFVFNDEVYNGYARASRIRVRLFSSSSRMWSSEMIMLHRSVWE